ncbi:MAG: enoyl-CoA hydratase/isomerase family protein [Myxococcota bacterium]|nr:enoyl-CoA hydratase/isomerase family protein [Myxococcota bacterium]
MNLTTIDYQIDENCATVTLLQPYSNMQMVRDLTSVCNHLEDECAAPIVVIRGSNGHFCRGINFAEFNPDAPMDIHGFNKWEKMCVRIERLPKITISILEGDVIGGGFQLALLTDFRIATSDIKMQLPEVKIGFLPGMGVFRLAKYIGLGHAKRLILQSKSIDAEEALQLGLVDLISDDLNNALGATLARFSPVNPTAVQLARRLLNESFHDSFEDALGHFLAAQHRAISQTSFLKTIKKEQPS